MKILMYKIEHHWEFRERVPELIPVWETGVQRVFRGV